MLVLPYLMQHALPETISVLE